MKSESGKCFTFFILQLLFFHLSSFMLMWALYSTEIAITINLILLVFLIVFIKNGHEIITQLHVSDSDAVTGRFNNFSDNVELNEAIPSD